MKKDFLVKTKEKLEKEKKIIEGELQGFAEKDKKVEGDWETKHPRLHKGSGGQRIEEETDEIIEYERLLAIEHALETKLQNINLALEKIKRGKYGICEQCAKPIPLERLEVSPEARHCLKCQQ